MNRVLVGALLGAAVLLSALTGAVLCEGALHIRPEMRWRSSETEGHAVATQNAARLETAFVTTPDGEKLKAWYLEAVKGNGAAVTLLHGVAASRSQMLGYSPMFLRKGYSVLLPDLRGHGESSGNLVSYGVQEAKDVSLWNDWLRARGIQKLYGLGESLGGAVLIQSLAREKRFRAIAAECAYSSFREVAKDRVMPKVPAAVAPILFWPVVTGAFLYTQARYGFSLDDADTVRAIRETTTPTLLIHGELDEQTPVAHSLRLAAANARAATVWIVPQARHTGAFGVEREQFEHRVTSWFDANR